MTEFEMLLACYRSGQVSERQWQAHMEDKAFRAWVEDRGAFCRGRAFASVLDAQQHALAKAEDVLCE